MALVACTSRVVTDDGIAEGTDGADDDGGTGAVSMASASGGYIPGTPPPGHDTGVPGSSGFPDDLDDSEGPDDGPTTDGGVDGPADEETGGAVACGYTPADRECGDCLDDSCCSLTSECANDPDCSCVLQCFEPAGAGTEIIVCLGRCGLASIPSQISPLLNCMTNNCPDCL